MKNWIITAAGAVGAAFAAAFGGWTAALTTLVIFMAVVYLYRRYVESENETRYRLPGRRNRERR